MNSKLICKMCGNKMTVKRIGKFLKIVCVKCGSEITQEVTK